MTSGCDIGVICVTTISCFLARGFVTEEWEVEDENWINPKWLVREI